MTRFAPARRLRALLLGGAPRLFLRIVRPTAAELGEAGERIAAQTLRRAGWRIVARRVATPHAEIDLVAAAPGCLVCVEVKTGRAAELPTRWDARTRPGRRLDAGTLARQRRAAAWLAPRLSVPGARPLAPRIDLVEVLVRTRPHGIRVLHHPGRERPL